MTSGGELEARLEALEGRPYPGYKELGGQSFDLAPYRLCILHVQGDPFAAPSRLAVELDAEDAALPEEALVDEAARRATADALHRMVGRSLAQSRNRRASRQRHGRHGPGGEASGKSGLLEIAPLGPEVLDRSAVQVDRAGNLRLLLGLGLPAAGRRILGHQAADLLCEQLPEHLDAVFEDRERDDRILDAVECLQDQVALREQLADAGLVAFLGEGALLPRRSGVDPRPLPDALPLEVPDALAVAFATPHSGQVRGLAIQRGITLVVGGAYHGKSTLLDALSAGVYDHRAGDGRERCVTDPTAMAIRAEDGRAVREVDLSPFLNHLPQERSVRAFRSDDASGSTSQAASLVEATEAGASTLLMDEDTSANNLLVRDARMRALISDDEEPITPLVDRARELHQSLGTSLVLVLGGSGEWFDVADRVLRLRNFQVEDHTEAAREVAQRMPIARSAPPPAGFVAGAPRRPDPNAFDARVRGRDRVRGEGRRSIALGETEIDLSAVSQLCDAGQLRLLGDVLCAFGHQLSEPVSVPELLERYLARLEEEGLSAWAEEGFGDRSAARPQELAAAINRMRSWA